MCYNSRFTIPSRFLNQSLDIEASIEENRLKDIYFLWTWFVMKIFQWICFEFRLGIPLKFFRKNLWSTIWSWSKSSEDEWWCSLIHSNWKGICIKSSTYFRQRIGFSLILSRPTGFTFRTWFRPWTYVESSRSISEILKWINTWFDMCVFISRKSLKIEKIFDFRLWKRFCPIYLLG